MASLAVPSVVLAQADEEAFALQTLDGRSYEGCKVLQVDPDGIYVSHNEGIAKLAFTKLSPELQEKYGYDAEKATEFIQKHSDPPKPAPAPDNAAGTVNSVYGGPVNVEAYGAVGGGYGGYGYPSGYGYGGYWDNGQFYAGNFHNQLLHRRLLAYPHYPYWPNLSFQLNPERRDGSPVAPPLVSTNRFQEQLRGLHDAFGFPEPRVPYIRPIFNPSISSNMGVRVPLQPFAGIKPVHHRSFKPVVGHHGGGGSRGGGQRGGGGSRGGGGGRR